MTDADGASGNRTVAEQTLERLGLSAYAARTYVALLALGAGTATEVSDAAAVPRTRVYDAADELQEWRLVEIERASPTEFHPVSAETATRRVERELHDWTNDLSSALASLEPARRRERAPGVWTVRGREAVTDRVREFVAAADERVRYAATAELLTEPVLAELRAAADRGVAVRLAGSSAAADRRLAEAVPSATSFDSPWTQATTAVGRLLVVDGRRTLVSVCTDDTPTTDSSGRHVERAIWGSGAQNDLVVVLRTAFAGEHRDGSQ